MVQMTILMVKIGKTKYDKKIFTFRFRAELDVVLFEFNKALTK